MFAGRCPALCSLYLAQPLPDACRADALQLLRTNGACLTTVYYHLFPSSAELTALASLPRLQHLDLYGLVRLDPANDVMKRVPAPFPALESLRIWGPADALGQLLSRLVLCPLAHLEVSVEDDSDNATYNGAGLLPAVAALRCVAALQLHLLHVGRAPLKAHFLALSQLQHLQALVLRLRTRHKTFPSIDLQDDEFARLVAGWPRLRYFLWGVRTPALTIGALESLGRLCPDLAHVNFM
jgi:hypothetical protein